ncbi:MAG: hypothetical protein KC414_13960 [Romboutsia sp.]|nr:hypothetical protein [Romboutsia sp.]
MTIDKNKILTYSLIAIIVILTVFGINQYFSKVSTEKLVKNYKIALIESDSLKQVSEEHYQKLVNDMNSQKDIFKLLKEQNEELYKTLKEENKKPISYTLIQAQPQTKIDTITIKDTVRKGQFYKVFKDYYPNSNSPFIIYDGEIKDNSLVGKFNFNTLDIGIVISEKQKDLFEADLDAPEWLKINNLQVNSLPLENVKVDNFDWMIGGSSGLNIQDKTPIFELEGGFRYKKSLFSIQGNINKEIKFGFKKLL